MSEANLEVARRIYDEWSRGDFHGTWWAHPRIEVVNAPETLDLGVTRGQQPMAEMWRSWLAAWAGFRVVPERFLGEGDHVLVLAHFEARGKHSGAAIDGRPAGTVFTFDDGVVAKMALFVDHKGALEEFARITSSK